jgi:hypothetical protein
VTGLYTNGTSKKLAFIARSAYRNAGIYTNVYSAKPTIRGLCDTTNNVSNVAFGQLAFYTVPPTFASKDGGAPSYAGVEVGRMLTNGWRLTGRLVQGLDATAYTYGSTHTVDFNGTYAQQLSVSGTTTLATTNNLAGFYERHVVFITAAAESTFTYPTNWLWDGEALTAMTNGAKVRLELESIGASEGSIIAKANQLVVPAVTFSWDEHASNFLYYAGIGFTNATATNVNNLALAAKAHGWWTNCDGIYPMVSVNDITNTTFNLRTNNGATPVWQITWDGATLSTTGMVFATGTSHGDVAFNASSSASIGNFGTNSAHLFTYVEDIVGASNQWTMAFGAATYYCDLKTTSGTTYGTGGLLDNGTGTTPSIVPADRRGSLLVTKTAVTAETIYAGGSSSTSNPSAATPGRPNSTLAIGAGNSVGAGPMKGTLAGASFGGAIVAAQAALMVADWNNFNQAEGRGVP